MVGKHTGRRLLWARKTKGYQLKELAVAFNVKPNTIQVWQVRGIPEDKIMSIAIYFGVEDWVFRDENISEIDFKNIILLPSFQHYYKQAGDIQGSRPVLLTAFEKKHKNNVATSSPFYFVGGSLFVITHVLGAKGLSFNQVLISNVKLRGMQTIDRMSQPPQPILHIITRGDTKPSDTFIQQDIINRLEKGKYSLSVYSNHDVKVYVYKINHLSTAK
jgi:hypothetical protein